MQDSCRACKLSRLAGVSAAGARWRNPERSRRTSWLEMQDSCRACKPNFVCRRSGRAIIPLGRTLLRGSSDLPGSCGAPSRHAVPEGTSSPIWSCSVWGFPCHRHYWQRGALLPHLFTLTPPNSAQRSFFWQLWESQLDGCPILSLLLGKGGKLNSSGAPGSPFFWANLGQFPRTSGSSWAGRYIFCGTFRKRPLKAAPRTLSGTPLYGVRTFLSQPAQPGHKPIVRKPAAITRPSS